MACSRKLLIVGTLDETLMIIKGRKIRNVVAFIKHEYNYNVLSFFGCTRPEITHLVCIQAHTDDEKIEASFEVSKVEAQEILDNILMQLPRCFQQENRECCSDKREYEYDAEQEDDEDNEHTEEDVEEQTVNDAAAEAELIETLKEIIQSYEPTVTENTPEKTENNSDKSETTASDSNVHSVETETVPNALPSDASDPSPKEESIPSETN